MKLKRRQLAAALALCLAGATCAIEAHAYGDVRQVRFGLRGPHGPYTAELYPAGSSLPIRRMSNLYPWGTGYYNFEYASTEIWYRVRVVSNGYGDAWIGPFYLYPNNPRWWNSPQYVGEIRMP